MALLDLLGRRWAMRVLWGLHDDHLGSRELQRRCDAMSSSMLNTRLGELADAGFVDNATGPWGLIASGFDLLSALAPVYVFADRWAGSLARTQRG